VEEKKDLNYACKANQTGYVDKANYVNNGAYLSASAKVISQVYKWNVYEMLYRVNVQHNGAADMIRELRGWKNEI